jgi:cell division protein FtsW (lipid II flippase)
MAQRLKTDWYLFITIVVMVFFGALMIFSASSVTASFKMGSSYYFVIRQMFWIVVAVGVMMTLKRTNYGNRHDDADRGVLLRPGAAPLDSHGLHRRSTF